MKLLRRVKECEVIAEFLKAEFYQREYDLDRERWEDIVLQPDMNDSRENALRRALLYRRRGHMWRELPTDTIWHEIEMDSGDLERIRVFPRAQWRKISEGNFRLTEIADRIRHLPVRGRRSSVIAKIQLLRYRLLHEPQRSAVLLIGVNEDGPLTILEGNHRLAAALLISPQKAQTAFRVLCGLSPRMAESCWYETNFENLWRYFKNRIRNISDPEADVTRAAHRLPTPLAAPVATSLPSASSTLDPKEREIGILS